MHISGIRVHNYKSFYDSEWIYFEPGINIISGQNNSGKTALLEALSTKFDNYPHRSLKTLPQPLELMTESFVEFQILFYREELINEISNRNYNIVIPIDQVNTEEGRRRNRDQYLDRVIKQIISRSTNKISIKLPHQGVEKIAFFNQHLDNLDDLAFNTYTPDYSILSNRNRLWEVRLSSRSFQENATKVIDQINPSNKELTSSTAYKLVENITSKIYRFYAERMNIGTCKFGTSDELSSDASNLAEVLNNLQGNPEKLREFNTYVSEVLPYIKWVSVRSKSNNEVEILVWTIDASTKRIDLASPLSTCGTGVSQVLSILYVLLTSSEPRTIIIDEPQSFLHPGAAKKLIRLLKQFSQHQYFISTHSPSVISAANPSTITLLRYKDGQTVPQSMLSDDTSKLRNLLDEVGVHLADIYGADNILWVEGPTEERCFQMILDKLCGTFTLGTQILAVRATGDLDGKRSHIIFDIYDKLSGGRFLFPPAIGFILDQEKKSKKEMDDLRKRSNGKVHFINRRMYENYLIDADAIASVANNQENFRQPGLTPQEVQNWIEDKKNVGKSRKYLSGRLPNDLSDDEWLTRIDAAKLLKDLFNEFSETRVDFIKTKHSSELTQWLIDNKPEIFDEIKELLIEIIRED